MNVLHINYALERGGIETWLKALVSQYDNSNFAFSLAYHRLGSDSMAADLRDVGMNLHQLPSPRSPLNYLRTYRALLRDKGPFDAVHSHLNFPGLLMLGARQEGVPARIAQSHVSPALMTAGALAGGYARVTNRLWLRHMTAGVAVSPNAACTLFGKRWKHNPKVHIEPCGIDPAPFEQPGSDDLRKHLGIPAEALVIGQVGRFSTEKNHHWTLRTLTALAPRHPELRLLLVGDGPTRTQTMQDARELGIDHLLIYAGERQDVAALLREVIAVLLLPSLTEGSPLTVIEAQAAGIPAVVSNAIPEQSILAPDRVTVVPLEHGVNAWANAIDKALRKPRNPDACQVIRESPFDIRHNADFFQACYHH